MLGYQNIARGWVATAVLCGIVQSSYLVTPEFQWSIPLISTATDNLFQKGNAIAPVGGDKLAITSSTGTLYLVKPKIVTINNTTGVVSSSNATKSYTPTLVSGMDSILCNGGIISVVSNSKTAIVMYAITDTDSKGQLPATSRILAVDTSTAQLVWNTTIDGTIVGTPDLSENGYLYVVHNVESTATEPNDMTTAGFVSIFQMDANVFAWTDIRPKLVTKLPSESTGQPFGPAAVATKDGSDVLFVAENMGDSVESFSASMFVIVQTGDDFSFSLVSRAISSSSTSPTLRENEAGEIEVFLGQPASTLLAWIGDDAAMLLTNLNDSSSSTLFGTPSWRFSVAPNSNSDAAIPNSPILSANRSMLYVTAVESEVVALNLERRFTAWSVQDLGSPALAQAVYHSDVSTSVSVVYYIESQGGILRQYNAVNGTLNWMADCSTATIDNQQADCGDVEADFAVSGDRLYYVDVTGNLAAWKVADLPVTRTPTSAPTETPTQAPLTATLQPTINNSMATTSVPTIATTSSDPLEPTTAPTKTLDSGAGVSDDQKSTQSWLSDHLAIVAAAAGGLLLILIILVICFHRWKRIKDYKLGPSLQQSKGIRPDENTVATTPEPTNEKTHEGFGGNGQSPLSSIDEVSDDEEQNSAIDVLGNSDNTKDTMEIAAVVQNLDQRFSSPSFDLEEGVSSADYSTPAAGEPLSRSSSGQSGFILPDYYSLASREKEEVGSQSGVASVNSKGSGRSKESGRSKGSMRSLKNLLGVTSKPNDISGQNDTASVKSEKQGQKSNDPTLDVKSEVKSITYFQAEVSPMASPNPDYMQPGKILPGQVDPTSPGQSLGSPTHSLASYDGSLYMDESTIASLEMPLNEDLSPNVPGDALAGAVHVAELPSDCPEDEVNCKLQPGLVYLNRHIAKKDQESDIDKKLSLIADVKRTQPMYNGVSVRPASRSRAGIFSRRQPKIAGGNEYNGEESITIPEVTPEPVVLRSRRVLVPPSVTKLIEPPSPIQSQVCSPPPLPPPRFTSAGYYVENEEPDDSLLHDTTAEEEDLNIPTDGTKQVEPAMKPAESNETTTKSDPWFSFLNELSKVENQFFNPTKTTKKKSRKKERSGPKSLLKGRPPPPPPPPPEVENHSESDDEELPPPPAPRTFYA